MRLARSLERLKALRPAFEDATLHERYPQIRWSVRAGNSSQATDGAGAMLIAEESAAARLGLKPRAAITHFALAGDDPILMLTAIIPAAGKVVARAGLSFDAIDAFEVNEAFASVVLAFIKELGLTARMKQLH
jgi:acetyl-CoA acyltransferase